MGCKEAVAIIREWGESVIRGKEARGSSGDAQEAFNHIRECRKEKCSQLWREFNLLITNVTKLLERDSFSDKEDNGKDDPEKGLLFSY